MTQFKVLGGVIVLGVVVVVLVIVAMQPGEYRVERSTVIGAPAGVVFGLVNDFHNWQGWSPWAKMDPAAKNTFEGSPAGKGAVFTWAGNKKIGEGRMTMLDSKPNELIRIKLEFFKPFAGTSMAEFEFKMQGEQTGVRWSMVGEKNFFFKMFCMFMDMDKMVGGDFEKGLASMKWIAEKSGGA